MTESAQYKGSNRLGTSLPENRKTAGSWNVMLL